MRLIRLLTLSLLFSIYTFAQTAPLTQTTYGPIQGQTLDQVNSFLGIPFAAPPIGDLRWQPPRPPQPWSTTRLTTQLPAPCPQQTEDDDFLGTEDCLYLNVWTPANARNRPVLFFLHGGANVQGSTSVQAAGKYLYDGSGLAGEHNVVVVTVQYRLGALGFLAHPALAPGAGNYGLRDQLFALEWVKGNIQAFGGDPGRVLLFGESAGAVNTCMLLASPLAKGLFHAALMQSGACRASTLADAQALGVEYANKVHCDSAQCLKGLSANDLVEAQKRDILQPDGSIAAGFGPSIDGQVLPAAPLDIIRQGQHNHVPFVIGANADESAPWTLPLTAAAYRATVLRLFGPLIGALVITQYPASTYDSPREALVAVTTDAQFVCPARNIARTVAEAQTQPVYHYFFTYTNGPAGPTAGAFHGLELWYIFQHAIGSTPSDAALRRSTGQYWTNFASTGDPNGISEPTWPRYIPGLDPYLELTVPAKSGDGVRTEKCDFWERLGQLASR